MTKINTNIIDIGTGAGSALSEAYFTFLCNAMEKFDINTPRRIAAFLANVAEESGGLKASRENLNYSAQGLANTWPTRYSLDSKAKVKTPNQLATKLNRNPEAIANNVYANRLGNGDESSGDGWKYRGVGWIQTTGKENIQKALVGLGLDKDADPAVLGTPEFAALSAAFFWKSHGCNELADGDQFSATVKTVNGQAPCETNGGERRKAHYRACVAAINALPQ